MNYCIAPNCFGLKLPVVAATVQGCCISSQNHNFISTAMAMMLIIRGSPHTCGELPALKYLLKMYVVTYVDVLHRCS